jgi:virginiamycin B lyase
MGGADSITFGPDGALWFTDLFNNGIGRMTTSGQFTKFPMAQGTFPGAITRGPDGALWFTEGGSKGIGRISTAGKITEYSYPLPLLGQDSVSLINIVSGPDGNLWFTDYNYHFINRMTTAGRLTQFATSGAPAAIAVGWDGALWFTETAATAAPKIGRITTSGAITEYRIADPSSYPTAIS